MRFILHVRASAETGCPFGRALSGGNVFSAAKRGVIRDTSMKTFA